MKVPAAALRGAAGASAARRQWAGSAAEGADGTLCKGGGGRDQQVAGVAGVAGVEKDAVRLLTVHL